MKPCRKIKRRLPAAVGASVLLCLPLLAYEQSPMLDGPVAAGTLPPVADRLPVRPIVITPLTRPGDYGGSARIFTMDIGTFLSPENPITVDQDISTLLPNLAESWTWNGDKSQLTMVLRKGLRWSDGHPLTSDDFLFNHYDLLRNSEYQPIPPPPLGDTELIRIDDYTFRWEFPFPYPLFENLLAQLGDYFYAPAHFFRQYHPSYADPVALATLVREAGYISWNAMVFSKRLQRNIEGPFPPTLRSHVIIRRTPTQVSFTRNPYYHKVDSQGRQLPYIDRVEAEVTENVELVTAKAATGQVDFAGYSLQTQDFPLFKLGERTSGVRALAWRRLHGSDIIIRPNFNIDHANLRELYWQFDFRRALSIAINRDEMNQIIYFGRGTPRQVTVIPTSSFFEPAFASAHAEYDPATARTLLGELGLVDHDGDGLREFADGTALTITVEYVEVETPRTISLELLTAYWRAVGLDVRMKLIDRALHDQRSRAGTMQMSVWHADRSTDLLFAAQPMWYVPIHLNWEGSQWNDWVRWYQSNGKVGAAPPPKIAQLHDWWEAMRRANDPTVRIRLGKNILRSTADNLWSIGTVGLAPHPIVINKRLKNVPETGLWGWDNRWTMPYHPASWFFEAGRAR